jgi:hypothetical protein
MLRAAKSLRRLNFVAAFCVATGEEADMTAHRIVAALMALVMMSGPGFVGSGVAQPVAAVPPTPEGPAVTSDAVDAMPPRLSYVNGEVSFWRPGATDWAPAQLNTPLAPGDTLYAGQNGALEVQIGQSSFVRANSGAQIGLDNQDANFIQFQVTAGQAGIDLRQLAAGSTVEIDTPKGAFTIDRGGYYHLDVQQDGTSFIVYRGGAATVTTAGGDSAPVAANQQVVLNGDSPQLTVGAAPPLTAWDNWNYQRSAALLQSASTRYVSPATYGTAELDRYGTWRTAEEYGTVWVPSGVPAGWQPYSTGRWIWDPRFGWTWLDDAPWGWAPYHHGRWVFVNSYWAWAPGPIVVRPVYAPALVVFLGGVTVGIGTRPLYWAPLSWGEPVIPWWGRRGFVGVPSWGGWGGPRVVNNTVINRNTTVNVTNINVYRNVQVNHAVVGVSSDRFGHGHVQVERVDRRDVQKLRPLHGAPDVKPVAASVMPGTGASARPPSVVEKRQVVATRAPRDLAPTLRENGLTEHREVEKAPRLVPAPKRQAPTTAPARSVGRAPEPGEVTAAPAPRGSARRGGGPEHGTPPSADAKPRTPPAEEKRSVQSPPPPGSASVSPPQDTRQKKERRGVQEPAAGATKTAPQTDHRRDVHAPPPPPGAPTPVPRDAAQSDERRGKRPPPPAAKTPQPEQQRKDAQQPEQRRGPQPPPLGAAKAPREAPRQPDQQRAVQPPAAPGAGKTSREAVQAEHRRPAQAPPQAVQKGTPVAFPQTGQNGGPPAAQPASAPRPQQHRSSTEKADRTPRGEHQDKAKDR